MNDNDMDKYIYSLLAPKEDPSLKSTFFDESIFDESEPINEYVPNVKESNSLLLRGTLNYKLKYNNVHKKKKIKRSTSFNSYFSKRVTKKDKEMIDYITSQKFPKKEHSNQEILKKLNKIEKDIDKIMNVLCHKFYGSSFYTYDNF